tara:strand:+ start:991 stop:1278 length:288 start_codon:yes stop_codon:yes gene_type:complete
MKNYITKREYGSFNQGILAEAGFNQGDEFLTFKQALKIEGISGKSLKGLKTVASLLRKVERPSKVKGKEDEMVVENKFYRVFYAPDVLNRIKKVA